MHKSIKGRLVRLLPVAALAATMGIVSAGPAYATVSGEGCGATAVDSTGKANPPSIDITSTAVWHISKDSVLSGEGHAGSDQTQGSASAGAFGFGIVPIASGSGHGTTGKGSLDVSQFHSVARVILGVGSSDTCSGSLVLIVDDESALDTWAGRASVGLLVIGAIGVLAVGLRSRG